MKKEIFQTIEIPENIEVNLDGNLLIVKGPEGELKREFDLHNLEFKKENNKIIVGHKKATKRDKKMINTIRAHINNMIQGVTKKFEYTLKICHSHFPMNVEVKDKEVIIKNFLGERVPRKAKILEGVDVKIDKEIITVNSTNKELAGQTAANIEKSTRIRKKDRRIFQDGIYIITKSGKEI